MSSDRAERRGRSAASLTLAIVVFAVGCGRPEVRDSENRLAAVYGAVIVALAGQDDGEHRPTVFVTARQDVKPLSLEVQAAILKDLDDRVVVRFVDDGAEAVDSGDPARPVTNGTLLRVGAVAAKGDPVEVQIERYVSLADQTLVTLSVGSIGGTWTARVIAAEPMSAG